MKKKFVFLLVLLAASVVNAQDGMRNKKGVVIFPEAGELSVGIDAIPFLRYGGSLFNDNSESPNVDFIAGPLTFSGLYVKRDNLAYRAKVRVSFGTEKQDTLVPRLGSTNSNETVADEMKTISTDVTLSAGIQKWRGKSRVKGYYGGEVALSIGTEKTRYSYGNALSSENNTARLKSTREGSEFGFQLRAFAGLEYFFAAKASVSGEFGWGPKLITKGRGETQTESWQGNEVDVVISNTGKNSSFRFDNDNAGGTIRLSFYF